MMPSSFCVTATNTPCQLQKFLQSRERGALFANANFRMEDHPNELAFDWLTFDQLRGTRDRTFQNSVIRYDPAMIVYVFVFLPSASGNSVTMWRRPVNVPNDMRLLFQHEIGIAKAGLRKDKDYAVHVDDEYIYVPKYCLRAGTKQQCIILRLPRKDKIKKGTLTRKCGKPLPGPTVGSRQDSVSPPHSDSSTDRRRRRHYDVRVPPVFGILVCLLYFVLTLYVLSFVLAPFLVTN